MAWLVALDPSLNGRRFSLDQPVLIGRGPINHIVIEDPRISRQHAKIAPEDGGHVVYDLNSANGTFVNTTQIKRHRLAAKDVVHVGPFKFSYEESVSGSLPLQEQPLQFGGRGEMRTLSGMDAPTRIVDSMDASLLAMPVNIAGLSELEDAERKLRTLIGYMQSISSTLDGGVLLDRIVADLFQVFARADVISLFLRDDSAAPLLPRVCLKRDGQLGAVAPLSVQVVAEVVQRGRAILSTPILPIPQRTPQAGVGLTMHAPMVWQGQVEGVIEVAGAPGQGPQFNQRDLDLLAGLATMAAMTLHSARLHHESLKQQRVQQDLLFAREIQQSFLPRELPRAAGMELAAEYRPAFTVGGDFYDVFWLDDRRLCMCIGDVAGKGVSAALLMARLSSDLRLAMLSTGRPGRALEIVNRSMLERGQHDIFVTAVCLVLDVVEGGVLLANAGHVPPLLRRRDGYVEQVMGGAGTAIGFFEGEEFPQAHLFLEPGETLLFCTDGILEAVAPTGELWGIDRLGHSFARGPQSAEDVASHVLNDLSSHVRDAPQVDDLTLIVLGRVHVA